MKLLTIGDSIAQGFMSGAAARTDLSFSTLIARYLGIPSGEYHYPAWPAGGLPFNIERVFRRLEKRYGTDIRGFEWATVLSTVNSVLDAAEEYYETGPGALGRPADPDRVFYHNIATRGFDVADAWLVTSRVCEEMIRATGKKATKDQYLGVASHAFHRTAHRVLNPSASEEFGDYSALGWLEHHARHDEGVENLVLWLGSNNALGTVLDLRIRQTSNDPNDRPASMTHAERWAGDWNLWHPGDFRVEYEELISRVDSAMTKNRHGAWRVFVGNVPLVTIAPLAKGVGATTKVGDKGVYYKYYTYVPFEESFARETGVHLTQAEALHIDDCIREYNRIIEETIGTFNKKHRKGGRKDRYFLVDFADVIRRIAWKRNEGMPNYRFPPYFDFIHPKVNTKFYHADAEGRLRQGGLFSLDGVHPTAIGHGIIAHEFLVAMKDSGVAAAKGYPKRPLDWPAIFASDELYGRPIRIMQELYQHEKLATLLVKWWRLLFRD